MQRLSAKAEEWYTMEFDKKERCLEYIHEALKSEKGLSLFMECASRFATEIRWVREGDLEFHEDFDTIAFVVGAKCK